MWACDFCNCYLGLNPHYKKNTFGIRYHYMNYQGTHMSDMELAEMDLSKTDFLESRTAIELHGQWYPIQKLQLTYSIPYLTSNERMQGHATMLEHGGEKISGIGDPLLIANYQIFNRSETDSSHYSQRLLAGGGIKFPFGKWNLEEDAESNERVHMPGTGSWDFLASAVYLGKYKRTGFNLNVTYLITTSNQQSFQFANRFNANATAYYQVKIKETALYPNIGSYLEQAGKDINGNNLLDNSGGSILFAHAGFDVYFKKISLSTAFQLPAIQKLNENQPELKYRLIAGISYAFN
jgi:hypothetical protein